MHPDCGKGVEQMAKGCIYCGDWDIYVIVLSATEPQPQSRQTKCVEIPDYQDIIGPHRNIGCCITML